MTPVTYRMMSRVFAVLLVMGGVCRGQEPGPSYKHLQFSEPAIGNWRVVTTEEGKTVSDGQEASEWILNKNMTRSTGWSQFRGEPAEYVFYTCWDPRSQEVIQWAIGATDSVYAIMRRTGRYDPAQRVWTGQHREVFSDGGLGTTLVKITFVSQDKQTIDFLQRRSGDEALPDQRDTFTRAAPMAAPPLESEPGPAYEHLKFLESAVGTWRYEGASHVAAGWEGEEEAQWILDKNCLRTIGWGRPAGGERFDYEILTAWESVEKKVIGIMLDSSGMHGFREGSYDPVKRCLSTRQTLVESAGSEYSMALAQTFDADHFVIRFSDVQRAGQPEPDFAIQATRVRP